MNPLNIPWGRKPKVEKKDLVPSFIGVRNEAVRDSEKAERHISISVRGLQRTPDGEYKLEWVEGQALKHYLSQLKLIGTAMRSAVRDLSNPEAGRVRMHYIPEEGAKIVLGNPSVSSALQFQRSSHDAQRVASRMGGGAKIVDVPLGKR